MHNIINKYLDAVENKYGVDVRNNTEVEHRGGTSIFLKGAETHNGQVVDMGKMVLMTTHLQSSH
ncbi:MAG: hypothetical protein Q9M31_02000 [Mariprofundus sp.]|nr:hypothetical protein [Mariprofundus sp.]